MIFDPTRSGAADEVTDLVTQKNKLSKVGHFFFANVKNVKFHIVTQIYLNSAFNI